MNGFVFHDWSQCLMTKDVRWETQASAFVVKRPPVIEPEVSRLQYSAGGNVAHRDYDVTVVVLADVVMTTGQQNKQRCHAKQHSFHGWK